MQKTIISDTSCLILLDNIGELTLLQKLFGSVIITSVIEKEFGKKLPEWIQVANPSDKKYVQSLLEKVDGGEASAIALAVEQKDCLLIIDDQRGRKIASDLGIHVTGTLGVLVDAKRSGHVPSIKPILSKIRNTNFRLSEEVEKQALKAAGE